MKRTYHLAFKEYGDPTLPTIVLLMGLGMPSLAWSETFIRTLVRQGLHVIAPDNRDAGESEHCVEKIAFFTLIRSAVAAFFGRTVKAPYDIDDMASDVEALLNEKGIERVHIAGFSLGGMIAQSFALRAPHRTISLTCVSTASGNPRMLLGSVRATLGVLSQCREAESNEVRYKKFLSLLKSIGSPEERYSQLEIARLFQVLKNANVSEQTVRRQLMAIFASGSRIKQLKQLVVPTLVIHGKKDRLIPIRAAEELTRTIEGAQLMSVPTMGHDIPESLAERIASAIAKHCYSGVLR